MPELPKRRSDHATQALHDGMQAKLISYLNQFHKQLALADPTLTENFLLEVIIFPVFGFAFVVFYLFGFLLFILSCRLPNITIMLLNPK